MTLATRLLYLSRGAAGGVAYAALKTLGVEFPRSVEIGEGVQLAHGSVGLVVHPATIVGNRVRFYQGVTVGRSDTHLHATADTQAGVTLEDDVILGANAVILFPHNRRITIGRGAVIGANSTVICSVPSSEVWAGSPARCVGKVPQEASCA